MRTALTIIHFLMILLFTAGSYGADNTTFVTPPWRHCLGIHKVGQFYLDILSGYSEKFDDPQGLFCIKLDCNDDTGSDKDDDELTVFGLNSGNHNLIFNSGMTSICIMDGSGEGLAGFDRPLDVTGSREGDVFVADTGNDRILHFLYQKDRLNRIGDIALTDGDPLSSPSSISLSGGLLFIADTGNDRIAVIEDNGKPVSMMRPEFRGMKLWGPTAVEAVSKGDDWVYYNDFFVAVVDSLGNRLWKISTDGEPVEVAKYSSLGRKGRFGHVAIDYFGNIYVTDTKECVIHKFSRHLEYITAIGGIGYNGIELDEPRGISIYRRFGQIFVSERSGAQYFWIGTDILRLCAENLVFDHDNNILIIDISFLLTEHSYISMYLEREGEKKSYTLFEDIIIPGGEFARTVKVPCLEDMELANCKIRLTVVAKPTYSSGEFLEVRRISQLIAPLSSR